MITERDYQNIIDTAAEDGRAEGFAEGEAKGKAEGLAQGEAKGRSEGKAEGLAEGKILTAKAMIAKGMDVNTISEITGLSCEEVNLCKESMA